MKAHTQDLAGLANLTGLGLIIPLVLAWRRGHAERCAARSPRETPPERWPSVSVIIPAWKERDTLGPCLNALAKVEYGGEHEIIVVAGGDDGTFEAAQLYAAANPRMQVLAQHAGAGKNGALNDGAARACGEVLALLDADARVEPGWLKALVAALGDRCAASNGKYAPTRRTLISRTGEMHQLLEAEARGRVILQGSGSIAVRRSAWDAIGGLPEGVYADDWVLGMLLRRQGLDVTYAPDARLLTERPATLGEWWQNELRWRRLHLASLSRAADVELSTPVQAAKALYPYISAWGGLALTLAALLSVGERGRWPARVRAAWLATAGPMVMREVGGAVETAAYTRDARWLQTAPVVLALTVLGWAASAAATLTMRRASAHFKGPRRSSVTAREMRAAEKRGELQMVEDILIGGVG